MTPLARRLSKLSKVDRNWLGALDGTQKVCGCYDDKFGDNTTLDEIYDGKVSHWRWRTLPESYLIDNVDYEPVILFISHFNINFVSSIVNKIINPSSLKQPENIMSATINGVLIKDVLYLQSKYKTTDHSFDVVTQDHYKNGSTEQILVGNFSLDTASYYCRF